MPKLPVAVQLRSLGRPFQESLRLARQLGARAVEIDARQELRPAELTPSALRQVRKWLADLELVVAAVSFPTRHGYDEPHQLEARVEATKAAQQMAYSLGASVVVNQVGRASVEPDSESFKLLVEALTDLANHGQRVGARLAAETGTESGADLARLLGAVPSGGIGVCLNPGQLIVAGHPPLDAVAELGSNVVYVRAVDGLRDRARGRGVAVTLGRGEADFPALLGALEEHDYRGYLCVQADSSTNPLGSVRDAISYFEALG